MGGPTTPSIAFLAVLVVAGGPVGLLGCGSGDGGGTSTAAPATAPAAEASPSAEAEAAEEVEPGRDLAGLRALVNDDGTITLSGTDRWGERFETTYADLSFFAGSVPVWKRMVTDDQSAALEAFLAELEGAAPADDPEEAEEVLEEEVVEEE
ncbi:MAG: hypothetical protein DRJ42_05535 [Deltaproteobacteria bacterium]|nr:MAG: hypothetical protein DRJ42_05535 [Deltaproteobacteria bacterium]